jgi:hypothetical protein
MKSQRSKEEMIVDRKWNLVLEAGEDTQEEIDL